jgi:hypothetical protein
MVNSNNYEGRNLSKRTCLRYKLMISVVISFLVVGLISSFTFDVFAAEKDPKNTCKAPFERGSKTCCWRVRVPGKILADTYCQTCTIHKDLSQTCEDPELQFRTKQPEDIVAPKGGVADPGSNPPTTNDPNVQPKDGKATTGDQNPPVNDNIPLIKNDANAPLENQRTQSSDSGSKNNK